MSTIKITKCDNEILALATTWLKSYQICDIKSGNGNTVDITINLVNGPYTGPLTLDGVNGPLSGTYNVAIPETQVNLALVGIDWGGEANFSVSVDGGTPYTYHKNDGGAIVVPLGDPYEGSQGATSKTLTLAAAPATAK